MALGNESGGSKVFVNVANGKFKVKSSKDNPNAVHRVNKDSKDVYELLYTTLTGLITDARFTEDAYGQKLELSVLDEGTDYVVNIPFGGSACISFMSRVEKIDLTQPVKLSAFEYPNAKGDYHNTYIGVEQGGKKIDSDYGKDKPKSFSQSVEMKIKGQTVWDDTKRRDEMKAILASLDFSPVTRDTPASAEPPLLTQAENDFNDDLPF